jgi:hypothetical protein
VVVQVVFKESHMVCSQDCDGTLMRTYRTPA